ncbi:MAG: 5-(carboxyamino)imidazole ribonucleotide synthase [Clostridium sp.]
MKEKDIIYPPSTIGIIGGGQLGRMLTQEAKRMGYKVVILDNSELCPAAQVADEVILGSVKSDSDIRNFVTKVDVTTYEFESINADVLCQLEMEGHKIYPSGRTLKKIQNKYTQKKLFETFQLPVPQMIRINGYGDFQKAIEKFGYPMIIKACSGGYDGKGNFVIKCESDLNEFKENVDIIKNDFMVEEYINFKEEVSIVIARDHHGEIKLYPIARNEHKNSILKITTVSENISEEIEKKIIYISKEIMRIFNDVGVFCVEYFITQKDEVFINEVAPRPHNSGHYTIEACITSQFEQQLRTITGLPLGDVDLISPAVMINILGDRQLNKSFKVKGIENLLSNKNVYFHFYGKNLIEMDKKVGHITVLNNDISKAREIAIQARKSMYFEEE